MTLARMDLDTCTCILRKSELDPGDIHELDRTCNYLLTNLEALKRHYVAIGGQSLVLGVLAANCALSAKYNAIWTLESLLLGLNAPLTTDQRTLCLCRLANCPAAYFANGARITCALV